MFGICIPLARAPARSVPVLVATVIAPLTPISEDSAMQQTLLDDLYTDWRRCRQDPAINRWLRAEAALRVRFGDWVQGLGFGVSAWRFGKAALGTRERVNPANVPSLLIDRKVLIVHVTTVRFIVSETASFRDMPGSVGQGFSAYTCAREETE